MAAVFFGRPSRRDVGVILVDKFVEGSEVAVVEYGVSPFGCQEGGENSITDCADLGVCASREEVEA